MCCISVKDFDKNIFCGFSAWCLLDKYGISLDDFSVTIETRATAVQGIAFVPDEPMLDGDKT